MIIWTLLVSLERKGPDLGGLAEVGRGSQSQGVPAPKGWGGGEGMIFALQQQNPEKVAP